MGDGIKGEPPGVFGGGVPQCKGSPSMGVFMDGDGEKKNSDPYYPF